MKFCTSCGTQLPDNAAFCGKCGTKQAEIMHQQNITASPSQQPIQPQYPQQQGLQQPIQQQYPRQQGFQQPIQQQYPQQHQYSYPGQYQSQGIENAHFNPTVPTLRFIWPKALTYMLFSFTPWINNLNVEINGEKLTPGNGIRFKEGFIVDVPLTTPINRIECWLTTPFFKNKINWNTKIININVDPSASYIVEIMNPMLFYLIGFASLIKYRIKNTMGHILFEG